MAYQDESEHQERALDRLLALSDGVFAFAITLLSLDLVLPVVQSATNATLAAALANDFGTFQNFIMSFLVVGLYWANHSRTFRYVTRVDPRLVWINLLLLLFIVLVPFATKVLDEYGNLQVAVAFYALVNAAAGLMGEAAWIYLSRAKTLLEEGIPAEMLGWFLRRSLIAPAVFILSIPLSFIAPQLAFISWLGMILGVLLIDRRHTRRMA